MIVERRQRTRFRCRIRVRIQVRNKHFEGYALDLSEEGARVSTDTIADIWTGDEAEIVSEELGLLTGRIQWREPGQFGLLFDNSTNTAAKINHIRKYFGPPVDDKNFEITPDRQTGDIGTRDPHQAGGQDMLAKIIAETRRGDLLGRRSDG